MEFMNKHTFKSLEMDYIFSMISPKTPYGIQLKSESRPYLIGEEEDLKRELDEIEGLIDLTDKYQQEFREIKSILRNIKEIRGSLKRAENNIVLEEVEFFEIKNFLFSIKDISLIQQRIENISEKLKLSRAQDLESLLDPEGTESRTFYIYDNYSDSLKRFREEKRKLQREYELERKEIISQVEAFIGGKLKLNGEINILKTDTERFNKAISCPYLSQESSTILMTTFKVKSNEKLNEISDKLEEIKILEDREEFGIRRNLTEKIAENINILNNIISKIAYFDYSLSKAKFAKQINGIKPIISDREEIKVSNGRHIKLERLLKDKGKGFVPVSFSIRRGVTVITGANMGGKTVNLKVAGILAAMTQYGLFVPAEEFRTCLFDYIYFSIGDMQSIDTGLSTFGSEISGMKEILNYSEKRGLILVDELARGTNPEEGYAISRAIVRYLKDKNALTLFTTHFDGITREKGIEHLRVIGLKNMDFKGLLNNNEIKEKGIDLILDNMDYRLERIEGEYSVPKDAINIARLMGLNEIVLKNAEEILKEGSEDVNE
ncbi:methionine ABC transporter substrate-binding protein [Fervidicella metallireducens AeB]|uniref:Methionine ABC transporter substrate-binding protein n=1 Tax=Fervidicella metallireducens AeB TaxID=1403537 RepID=A0A017RYD6_9CLOT|nr:hypothetical protein [Fervidicella metallireducens]EYE89798.1 methionine ABC transporter substrate-binding protein [Fervidicella metallireducens AeB]